MNAADQAAHAIDIAARYFGCLPLSQHFPNTIIEYLVVRQVAVMLLSDLPGWSTAIACRVLEVEFLAWRYDLVEILIRLRPVFRRRLENAKSCLVGEPEEVVWDISTLGLKASQWPAVVKIG